jgi:hypothetical protein
LEIYIYFLRVWSYRGAQWETVYTYETFNDTELIKSMNVRDLPQNATASTAFTIITTSTLLLTNVKISLSARRAGKTTFKTALLRKVIPDAVEITKIFMKFTNIVVSRRNPDKCMKILLRRIFHYQKQ